MISLGFLSACLDQDVSTVYYYQGYYLCNELVAVDLDGVGSCFDKARYKSVIVKTESGTDNKILIDLMNEAGRNQMERVKHIQINERDIKIIEKTFPKLRK